MPLPDVSCAVDYFATDYIFEKGIGENVDENTGQQIDNILIINATATIVASTPEEIQKDNIDWSKKYIKVHTTNIDNYIESQVVFKGINYLITDQFDNQDAGYIKLIGEEIK